MITVKMTIPLFSTPKTIRMITVKMTFPLFYTAYLETRLFIGQWDLDLSIQPTGTQKSRIESVWTIGGHDDLDLAERVEPVHLIEQLHQSALNFAVR